MEMQPNIPFVSALILHICALWRMKAGEEIPVMFSVSEAQDIGHFVSNLPGNEKASAWFSVLDSPAIYSNTAVFGLGAGLWFISLAVTQPYLIWRDLDSATLVLSTPDHRE